MQFVLLRIRDFTVAQSTLRIVELRIRYFEDGMSMSVDNESKSSQRTIGGLKVTN